ncbi:MAG TPA: cupin domain-containing protein [Burkholderiales bacterium]|nr:cupin domain-containing protein [Burkholderiales bacterium]
MTKLIAPAFDPKDLPEQSTTGYPEPYKTRVAGRHRRRLGDAAGLKNFGVNLTRLDPGAESSMRHWHTKQDEFIYVTEGEVTLVTDAGRQKLTPGMAAGFPAGKADGHQLVNETDKSAVYLEIGDRTPGDGAGYSDADLAARMVDGKWIYTHKDGSPYK